MESLPAFKITENLCYNGSICRSLRKLFKIRTKKQHEVKSLGSYQSHGNISESVSFKKTS